jgi:hypothetical protein
MTISGAPWKFSPWHIEEGPPAVLAADGWYVCTTSSDEHAQLISAAPDAIAALKLALEYWAHRQQRYKNRHPVWVQAAQDALAKAGQSTS